MSYDRNTAAGCGAVVFVAMLALAFVMGMIFAHVFWHG